MIVLPSAEGFKSLAGSINNKSAAPRCTGGRCSACASCGCPCGRCPCGRCNVEGLDCHSDRVAIR